MARWATGVAVVTGHGPAGDCGLTVNALLSVALDPPMVLVSLAESADSTPVIRATGLFAASFLAADQRALSERFARAVPPPEKFAGVAVHRGVTGAPLLDGALGTLDCRVRSATVAGDHLLVLGDVVGVEMGRDATPLVFFRRGYATAGAGGTLTLAPPEG